jgi:hypothetical protein
MEAQRGLEVEVAGDLELGGAVGHQELPVLLARQRPTESVPAAQVSGGVVERGLSHADAGRADADPAVGQGLQGDLQAAAVGAQQRLGSEPHVLQDDVGGDLAAVAQLGAARDGPG